MQYELLLMLLFFLLPACFAKSRRQTGRLWLLVSSAFLLWHRAFFPFLLSGLYLRALWGVSGMVFTRGFRGFLLPDRIIRAEWLRFLGYPESDIGVPEGERSGDLLLSKRQRGALMLSAVILTVLLIQLCRINIAADYDSLRYGLRSPYVLLCGGGLSGFLKNPGLVNTVYTYAKGYELLMLPLSFLPGYGFMLCANVWVLIGVLALCGRLARRLLADSEAGRLAAFFCALMPGVTNMAVTAKSDLLTLFCQLLFVGTVLDWVTEAAAEEGVRRISAHPDGSMRQSYSRRSLVGFGLSALAVSYALKPTAMIFSSGLALCALCCLFWVRSRCGVQGGSGRAGRKRRISLREEERLLPDASSARVLICALLFTALCWLRTFLLTGLPVTSVFSGIFSAIGFRLRYPFSVQQLPAAEGSGGVLSGLLFLLKRLLCFLIFPAGEDMAHVRMAWGGIIFVLLLALLFAAFPLALRAFMAGRARTGRAREDCAEEKRERCADLFFGRDGLRALRRAGFLLLFALYFTTLLLSLLSLRYLYQVDGNYYMLLYALTAVLGTGCVCRFRDTGSVPLFWGDGRRILPVVTTLMLYVTAFTGWAGAVGFTETPDFRTENSLSAGNLLYYDHAEKQRQKRLLDGSEALISVLETEGKGSARHVIAFAQEPDCYGIRCVTESYTDIAGSGGNVYLVKTLNLFKEYLHWSGTDNIYADLAWLRQPGNERAAELLSDLIGDGTLTGLCYAADESGQMRYLSGTIDRARAGVPWETPLGAEDAARAKEAHETYLRIYGA